MNNEFKKISKGDVTRYVLENASSGGTSSGSVASVSMPIGSTRKRGDNILAQEADKKTVPVSTPRNFVAKNAKTGGAGQHKDKKKAEKQGDVKHRKPFAEQGVAEEFNGEYDDEAGMAQSNLLTTARAVMGLLKTIKDRDNLPEWGQEKIAKAEMMLVSVWDYLQSQKAMGNDPQQGVEEGWDDIKKFGKKAAVAGAIGLGIGAANAGGWSPSDVPAGGHNQLPDIVANVKFKVGDKEVSKEINLGSHYRSPGEAGEELKNFLNSKGIKFYQYSLERVKPKANDKIDNSPATSDMKGSMDTSEPGATGPSTDNYMAKDNDPERGPSTGGKFVKEDPYFKSLQTMMERQLEPTMDLDAWVDNFQNADPNKYHQFKNKTPEKKK